MEEEDDQNKLWVIVRYMTIDGRTNEYRLIGGETIKIGRVKFRVREIVISEDETKTDFNSFMMTEHNNNILPQQMLEEARII